MHVKGHEPGRRAVLTVLNLETGRLHVWCLLIIISHITNLFGDTQHRLGCWLWEHNE